MKVILSQSLHRGLSCSFSAFTSCLSTHGPWIAHYDSYYTLHYGSSEKTLNHSSQGGATLLLFPSSLLSPEGGASQICCAHVPAYAHQISAKPSNMSHDIHQGLLNRTGKKRESEIGWKLALSLHLMYPIYKTRDAPRSVQWHKDQASLPPSLPTAITIFIPSLGQDPSFWHCRHSGTVDQRLYRERYKLLPESLGLGYWSHEADIG